MIICLMTAGAVFCHVWAFFYGLLILHEYGPEFTNRPCPFKNGIDEVEVSYLTVVISSLVAPITLYHLFIEGVNLFDFSDTNEWDAAYWLALGLLLSLFHVITRKLMEKVRKDGLHSWMA